MKTPIKEIIKKIKEAQSFILANDEYAKGYNESLSDCVNLLQSFLEKEKIHIIKAAEYGGLQKDYTNASAAALDYYNENFKS